jgi:acetyl-CoA carboxylase biotin carboxyl carrier protein
VQQPHGDPDGLDRTASASADALAACAGLSGRELAELLALVGKSDIVELELGFGSSRLRLQRVAPIAGPGRRPEAPAGDEPPTLAVASPLVGLFHPTVSAGDEVAHGQAIGAIESLGISNTVDAPEAGTVEALLAQDGSAVEYGQPLLILRRRPQLPA